MDDFSEDAGLPRLPNPLSVQKNHPKVVFECGVGDDRALKNYPVDDFSEGAGLPCLPNPPSVQKNHPKVVFECGVGGIRTLVQTSNTTAFYTLSPCLIFVDKKDQRPPTYRLFLLKFRNYIKKL